MKTIALKNFSIGTNEPLTIAAGPCVIEGETHALEMAAALKKMFASSGIQLIYKSSYDKANRSSISSYRGPGLEEGLRILSRVKEEFDIPVLTDVHSPEQATAAGKVVDVLQIPAFLCRQTDLLVAAARTGKIVQVKKGQFMSPWDMKNVIHKLTESGCEDIILVDRGVSFGYNNLVSDMRAIPVMQSFGYPVCFDATHSVQLPGGQGTTSGGQREFIQTLARASLAAGANMLFIETHQKPEIAKSDSASMLPLEEFESILPKLKALYELMQS